VTRTQSARGGPPGPASPCITIGRGQMRPGTRSSGAGCRI
jgi:hypothetical protein